MTLKVAALYVDPKGPYFGRPDVDPWDEIRDARLYAGPWPVVAHPPCARWGQFWWRGTLGADGGCFEAALESVNRWYGVLEHPEGSLAWARFGLEVPTPGRWTRGLFGTGWTCSVDQGRYGHRARKRTWLYYVGANGCPPSLDWRPFDGEPLAAQDPDSTRSGVEVMTKLERRLTPPPIPRRPHSPRSRGDRVTHAERRLTPAAFAEVLVGLARSS